MKRTVAPSSGVAVVVLAVLAGLSVVGLRAQTGATGWDAVFGALTDTKFTNTLALLWWGMLLISPISALTRAEVLIRLGSPARAVRRSLTRAGITLAFGVVAVCVVAAVAASGGPETPWRADPAAGAFTPADLATYFPSPWLAAAVSIAFTAVTYAVIGLVVLTLTVMVNGRVAIGALVVLYLWAALSSFGTFDTVPGADLSRLISLPWTLHTGALAPALLLLGVATSLCALSLWLGSRPGPARLRHAVTSRSSAIIFPAVAGALALLMPTPDSERLTGFLSTFFAGARGDIIQYAAIMALVLGYATTAAYRLFEHASERFTYEAVRLGSPTRWTLRIAGAEIAIAWAVGLGIVATSSGAHLLRTRQSFTDTDFAAMGAYGAAVAIQAAMYVAIAVTLLWLCTSPTIWLTIVGVSLTLGYPLIVNLGAGNIFASFSARPDPITVSATAAAGAVALLASLLAGRVLRTPAITI